MIEYNPKAWLTFIFHFHKADTFRQLFRMMILIGMYSGLICFLEVSCWKLGDESHVKNIPIMHGMLGFVISLLLAYRTNTAYDRWWEGRKLWGSLVNNSRNLAIKLSAMLTDEQDRKYFRFVIPMFATILSNYLRKEEVGHIVFSEFDLELTPQNHKPNQVARSIFAKINALYKAGKISGDQLIILNPELQTFIEVCGACERIKNTPIPYSYSVFIKKFIFFYVMTLPFGYVFSLGYYVIPVVVFVFYVLASLEIIAEEIEDPFGNDANDLPTVQIAETIKKNINELL